MPDKNNGPDKDKIDRDEIEQEYGLAYALFKAFPELEKLLRKAVNQSWDANKFQVELRQTEWFKTHSDVWRQNIALKYSDPSTYKERLGNSMTILENLAGAYGAKLSDKASKRLAERALLFGWDENQIRDQLARFVKPSQAGHYGGQLSAVETQLRNTALRNGVRINRDQLQRWMKNIVRGDSSQEQYETFIRAESAKTFSAYADQINGGMDLADVASPYIQTMSEILELNPAGIDLYDRTIRRALSYKTEKGEPSPMSISEFEDTLRQDKRWAHTQQANDQARGYVDAISRMWGLRA